jgi:ABC-type multidrug transport system fused ATPase/permease subunit
VLGVIKVLVSLRHRQLPPAVNFAEENPHIGFAGSPVYVNTTLREWVKNSDGSRLAAVSSFSYSGTNAHAVLEDHSADVRASASVDDCSRTSSRDMADIENKHTSQLMSLVHSDSATIRQFMEVVPATVIDKVVTLIIGSLFLLWVSPISLFLALIPVPIVLVLFRRGSRSDTERRGSRRALPRIS